MIAAATVAAKPVTINELGVVAPLRTEQRERHDRDSVWSPVRLGPGRDNRGIQELIADLVAEPPQVRAVTGDGNPTELHLDGDDTVVGAFHDEIDLAASRVQDREPLEDVAVGDGGGLGGLGWEGSPLSGEGYGADEFSWTAALAIGVALNER